jgi:transposase
VIYFSFIHDRVAELYCPRGGRPSLDPILMSKALLIGDLFGIRSEWQLPSHVGRESPVSISSLP